MGNPVRDGYVPRHIAVVVGAGEEPGNVAGGKPRYIFDFVRKGVTKGWLRGHGYETDGSVVGIYIDPNDPKIVGLDLTEHPIDAAVVVRRVSNYQSDTLKKSPWGSDGID